MCVCVCARTCVRVCVCVPFVPGWQPIIPCLPVCLSVCMSVCLYICLARPVFLVVLSVCLCACLSEVTRVVTAPAKATAAFVDNFSQFLSKSLTFNNTLSCPHCPAKICGTQRQNCLFLPPAVPYTARQNNSVAINERRATFRLQPIEVLLMQPVTFRIGLTSWGELVSMLGSILHKYPILKGGQGLCAGDTISGQ